MTKSGIARIVGECVLGGGCIGGGSAACAQTSKLSMERANKDKDIEKITSQVNAERNKLSGARNKVNMAVTKVKSEWNSLQDCMKGEWVNQSGTQCSNLEKLTNDAIEALQDAMIGEVSN